MADKKNPKLRKNGGEGTFLGNALRTVVNVSPELLSIIGTVAPGLGGLTSLIGNVVGDKNTPQDTKDILLAEIQKDIAVEMEITKRWESDNNQEHWLPKLIRPLVLANYTLLIDFVIISATWGKPLAEAYVPILMTMGVTATGGYFALREYGKTKNK